MANTSNSRLFLQNRLLSVLPAEDIDLLRPHLELVKLSTRDILFQTGDKIRNVYFPLNGMISCLAVTEEGQTTEIAFTGFEGLVGLPLFLGRDEMPYQTMVQVPADCFRVDAKIARELYRKSPVFHDIALRYVYLMLKQVSQTCVCNHFHTIEARLCRWLCVMHERSREAPLHLTQEFLSQMLGVQRTSIGLIANNLQNAGVIQYRRGKIDIVDFDRLKKSACECYQIIRNEYDAFRKDNNFRLMSDSRQT